VNGRRNVKNLQKRLAMNPGKWESVGGRTRNPSLSNVEGRETHRRPKGKTDDGCATLGNGERFEEETVRMQRRVSR